MTTMEQSRSSESSTAFIENSVTAGRFKDRERSVTFDQIL